MGEQGKGLGGFLGSRNMNALVQLTLNKNQITLGSFAFSEVPLLPVAASPWPAPRKAPRPPSEASLSVRKATRTPGPARAVQPQGPERFQKLGLSCLGGARGQPWDLELRFPK